MAHNHEHETIHETEVHDVPVSDAMPAAVDEVLEGPDYARGQREGDVLGRPADEGGDFARGLDDQADMDMAEGPDFARGQREDEHSSYIPGEGVTGSEEQERPDYARGQRTMDDEVTE